MSSPPAQYPSTVKGFNRRFPKHKSHTIHTLSKALRNASGSNWRAEHLQSCRVILRTFDTLPILESFIPGAREAPDARLTEVSDLKRLSLSQVREMSHAELRAEGGVFDSFYVALADVSRLPELAGAVPDRPQRDRKPTQNPGYDPGEGLSSPISESANGDRAHHPPSSPYTPESLGRQDYDSQLDEAKLEAVTADLAAQFISTVLDRLSNQNSKNTRIESSRAPTTFVLDSSALSCSCQDDGSIVWRRRGPVSHQWSTTEWRCSLEVKSQSAQLDDLGRGVVSDRVIAQQVCEMLGSVMSLVPSKAPENLDAKDQGRCLISLHHTNIAFLYAHFSLEYLNYIYSKIPPQELPHLEVHRSKDFDLRKPEDREMAAEVIVALALSFIKQEEQHLGGDLKDK